jgi:hypothetical protein
MFSQKESLARALKYKNRLVGKIAAVTDTIRTKNSIIKGSEREVDIEALASLRVKLIDNLIILKTAINQANGPIVRDIFAISELKAESTFLSSIDTTHGKATKDRGFYNSTSEPVEFEAYIRFNKVEELKTNANKKIDAIQEKIDKHNHSTTINVEVLEDVY